MATNRVTLLGELRQLVDEIDNNNYVARKVYDYCEKYKLNGEFNGKNATTNRTVVKQRVGNECSATIVQSIIHEAPLMAPHYHMAELFSNVFTLTVNMIDAMRTFLRNLWLGMIGRPMTQSIAIQYDVNSTKVRRTYTPFVDRQPIIPDIGESNLVLVLGDNRRIKESTYTMYQGGTKMEEPKYYSTIPVQQGINSISTQGSTNTDYSTNSNISEVTCTQTSLSYLCHEINTQTSNHSSLKSHSSQVPSVYTLKKSGEIETQTDFLKSKMTSPPPSSIEISRNNSRRSKHSSKKSVEKEIQTNDSEQLCSFEYYKYVDDIDADECNVLKPAKDTDCFDRDSVYLEPERDGNSQTKITQHNPSSLKGMKPNDDETSQTSRCSLTISLKQVTDTEDSTSSGSTTSTGSLNKKYSLKLLHPRSFKLTSLPELSDD